MRSKWTKLVFFFFMDVILVRGFDDPSPKKYSPDPSGPKEKPWKAEAFTKKAEAWTPGTTERYRTEPLSGLGVTVPPEDANYTLREDSHSYYNSTFYSDRSEAERFWVDLDSLPQDHVVTHAMLSDSHRQATTAELSFDFPFYGTPVRNITIATGGFLYTGDYLHNWIAATQYVAPLMANFDTGASPESTIRYADNGTAFTVQWGKVSLQDKTSDGAFTFQATLLRSGDIIFAYKDVPLPVANISDAHHPVKIGISDAYILERAVFFIRRKTIYEYNRIDMMKREISNNTAIYFTALPTCVGLADCGQCLASRRRLGCDWCDAVGRCSDGIDRLRQDWLAHRCTLQKEASCAARLPPPSTGAPPGSDASEQTTTAGPAAAQTLARESGVADASGVRVQEGEEAHAVRAAEAEESGGVSAGALATLAAFLAVLAAAGVWVFYAYRHPETSSGQFLIKYRPSQWVLKKEDASASSGSRHL